VAAGATLRSALLVRGAGAVATAVLLAVLLVPVAAVASEPTAEGAVFPRDLASYGDAGIASVGERLLQRADAEPFNAVATLIFVLAILHTFLSSKLLAVAHRWGDEHRARIASGEAPRNSVSPGTELLHFLGEVEAIFGIWAVALGFAVVFYFDWPTFVSYIHGVNFTEPMFVVVIMTLASTRPILWLAEAIMGRAAGALGGTVAAWWFTVLTLGPLLGSFITEPAAMTISAMVLARKFYELEPSEPLQYATIGLLFVNVSVGGTLTHFAAPPVLMVAAPWGWDTSYMLSHFGGQAALGIVVASGIYFVLFRRELARIQDSFLARKLKEEIRRDHVPRERMEALFDEVIPEVDRELQGLEQLRELVGSEVAGVRERLETEYIERVVAHGVEIELAREAFRERFEEVTLARLRRGFPRLLPEEERPEIIDPDWDEREDPVPAWVVLIHVGFLAWTVLNAHHPALFVAGLLFFLGFSVVTAPYQNRIDLKPPLLVGFFLAGLVVHGGLQAWWIEPVLGGLSEVPMMLTATVLTAFNDNAAITFLATLIPELPESLEHAVVAGAVAGGGLTVIANAPNPAGQAILKGFFSNGVSPLKLLAAAAGPTVVVWLSLYVLN
jgi:hypothetical protein